MKADGSVLIDTKISTGGMEKGFKLLKSEMSTVGTAAKQVSSQIESSFSGMNLSKSVSNAISKVKRLETQLASVSSELKLAMDDDDDSATERLLAKKTALYDRLEEAREKLAAEVAEAARKEADEEEKAAQRATRAAEKKANAQKKEAKKNISDVTRSVNRFNTRFTGILSSALFFNIISSGLSEFTSYVSSALEKNDEFSSSLSNLKGSLSTAFQPIYNSIVPALTSLVNWLNTAVQIVGKFFTVLTGSDYSDVMDDAEALNNEADAISGVGDAAEEASRQLAGFDELNRLESLDSSSSSSGSGSSGSSSVFEEVDLPSEWEETIESLALRVKDIFFEWDDLNAEIVAEKLITALTTIAGGVIGFSIGGVKGAVIGMTVGAALGVAISNVIFDGDGTLSKEELLTSLTTVLFGICGGIIGFAVGGAVGAAIGITIGASLGLKLSDIIFDGDGNVSSDEMLNALVSGLTVIAGAAIGFAVGGPAGAVIGATLGLALAFTIQSTIFDNVGDAVKGMLDDLSNYFSVTFSDGFINGLSTMVEDGVTILWNCFVDFLNSVIENWNSIWSNISSYQTSGTIGSSGYSTTPSATSYARTPDVPYLAQGAVLPANKPFLAVVGDQTNGTNVEAPLSTIKQALSEVMTENGMDVNISFNGSLSELARILAPVITKEQRGTSRARGT